MKRRQALIKFVESLLGGFMPAKFGLWRFAGVLPKKVVSTK